MRLLHWTLAASFLGAYALADWRDLHETLGWIAVSAALVRVVWGFAGTRHARFADFVPTPAGFLGYARDVARKPRVAVRRSQPGGRRDGGRAAFGRGHARA